MKKNNVLYFMYMPILIPGIFYKLKRMALVASNNNLKIDFLILNFEKDYCEDNLRLKKIKLFNLIPKILQRIFFKYALILKNVDFDKYDFIIFRHVIAPDFSSVKLFNKYGYKIISEHHTNEIFEYKHRIKNFKNHIEFFLERFLTPIILKKCKGISGVTKEICILESKKSNNKNLCHIPNGLDLNTFENTSFLPYDKKILKLIFVFSSLCPWHGLERLLNSLAAYKGNRQISLLIIGQINDNKIYKIVEKINNDNIKIIFKGVMSKELLEKEYLNVNLGVSSLALYKNKMKEGSPLKSAEYLARGLPFIYAYDDENLEKHIEFALKFPNNDSIISIESIIEFAEKNNKNISVKMRKYAEKNLSYRIILNKYYNFCLKKNKRR